MIFFWIATAVLMLFGFVVLFGAPYLPTLSAQQESVFEVLGLKPGQVFYDLGSGDGRMLKAAAKRGYVAVGYEINPILAMYSWLSTRRYGKQVKIVCGNFWRADLADADGIFVFLLAKYMSRLDKKLSQQHKKGKLKLASYSFAIPGKKMSAKKGPIYLYKY